MGTTSIICGSATMVLGALTAGLVGIREAAQHLSFDAQRPLYEMQLHAQTPVLLASSGGVALCGLALEIIGQHQISVAEQLQHEASRSA